MLGTPPPKANCVTCELSTIAMIASDPPPAAMLLTLMLIAHVPRLTRTIPCSEPGANAAQPLRLPPAPSPNVTGPEMVVVSGADHGWKIAIRSGFATTGALMCIRLSLSEGTAVCATEMAVRAADGVLTI